MIPIICNDLNNVLIVCNLFEKISLLSFITFLNSFIKRGNESLPKSVIVPRTIHDIQNLLMERGHVFYCEVQATVHVTSINTYKIFHDHFSAQKVYFRWIPQNLRKSRKKMIVVDWCKYKCLLRNAMALLLKTNCE